MSDTITREEFKQLQDQVKTLEKAQKMGKAPKAKRAPSAYNTFVGDKIKEIKAKTPTVGHTDAFKQAVEAWKVQKKA